jgi:hypothetical protein
MIKGYGNHSNHSISKHVFALSVHRMELPSTCPIPVTFISRLMGNGFNSSIILIGEVITPSLFLQVCSTVAAKILSNSMDSVSSILFLSQFHMDSIKIAGKL